MAINKSDRIAIFGAGAMGAGIAQTAAQAGHPVTVVDRDDAALDRGRAGVAASLAGLVARGKLSDSIALAVAERIQWTTDAADCADAALFIEAIIERADAKAGLFESLSSIAGPQAIVASNTSSLSITELARTAPDPTRFIGLHFFNPVPAMKLVEVIPGARTIDGVTADAEALMAAWGKTPVKVRDVPGFIVNRVARPYYAEGFAALGEGVPPTAVDDVLTGPGGFRMGPLALADLIGHDVNFAVASSVFDAYDGNTRFRPQPAQRALVDQGRLGRKTGQGVYTYPREAAPSDAATTQPPILRYGEVEGELFELVQMARVGGLPVETDPALIAGQIMVAGSNLALGDGRRLADRPEVDILLDHARDLTSAPSISFTARDQVSADAARALIAGLGKRAISVPDRPGLIALRTLAQLANAAADAVADEVASAEAIDQALLLGANHPEGPLAWADRYGRERVGQALNNIAAATGDPIYRPASRFEAPEAPESSNPSRTSDPS